MSFGRIVAGQQQQQANTQQCSPISDEGSLSHEELSLPKHEGTAIGRNPEIFTDPQYETPINGNQINKNPSIGNPGDKMTRLSHLDPNVNPGANTGNN